MAKRYKIKKKVWKNGGLSFIFLVILILLGTHIYNDYKYKHSYEFKLIEHGYKETEAKNFIKVFSNDELKDILNIPKDIKILDLGKEKYYIHKNLNRYLSYLDKNKKTSYKDIIAIVNVNRDYDYYDHDIESNTSLNEKLIVNKYYKLKEDFEPDNLVNISIKYAYSGNKISDLVNDAYVSMWNAANDDGVKLIVNSSYRSYKEQNDVYESLKATKGYKEADKVAARPGYSEHQSGLAIDVFSNDNSLTGTFKDSKAYEWLSNNAYKYGFIERYPEDKEYLTGYSFESWHWRYVGEDIAKIIHKENITYDEYYAYYIEAKK